ncbi:nitrile hydratase accessory protein [Phenylobacterium sp.]|uniref:nitrile hydratase accessory protein n=1 Tax=Phenylobacterium sp. TaxID=1871053 RepID=UPI0025EA820E|nr:nitrile hydratase accessory protein [Phenylobacterium sp.]
MNVADPPGLSRDTEQVFAEPWQAQAFALVLALHARDAFTWREWADELSRELAAAGPDDDGSRYYDHLLATLELLAVRKRLAAAAELSARKAAWADAYRRTAHGRPVELTGEPSP